MFKKYKMRFLFIFLITITIKLHSQENLIVKDTITYSTLKLDSHIFDKPDLILSKSILKVFKNDTVYVLSYKKPFWQVTKQGLVGWISDDRIWLRKNMGQIKANGKLYFLQNKYGNEIGKKINNNAIWVGMTRQMLYDSKGYPNKNNTSFIGNSKSEQLIYKSTYVYIENDIVTAIQYR